MAEADSSDRIARARRLLAHADSVAVLTGAGISAESGVPTFRGSGGLWSRQRMEDVATPAGFARDPVKVWRFHNELRIELERIAPNAAHLALARLERAVLGRGGRFALATQNIDGLHQAAGSRGVLELHGSLTAVRCTGCDYREDVGFRPLGPRPTCPDCGKWLRPDVVWFGETLGPDVWAAAVRAARSCQVFLSVGTSALVYPAAGLIEIALSEGPGRGRRHLETSAGTIEVNLEPTPASGKVDVALHGRAGHILPQIVA